MKSIDKRCAKELAQGRAGRLPALDTGVLSLLICPMAPFLPAILQRRLGKSLLETENHEISLDNNEAILMGHVSNTWTLLTKNI